jgi:hypothetical protein
VQLAGHRLDDVRLMAVATALEEELDAMALAGLAWPVDPIVTHGRN